MFQVEAGHAGAPEIRSPPVMATGRGGFPAHSRFLCRRRQTALALHLLTNIVRHDDSPVRVRAILGRSGYLRTPWPVAVTSPGRDSGRARGPVAGPDSVADPDPRRFRPGWAGSACRPVASGHV